jgi:hypothetical protein
MMIEGRGQGEKPASNSRGEVFETGVVSGNARHNEVVGGAPVALAHFDANVCLGLRPFLLVAFYSFGVPHDSFSYGRLRDAKICPFRHGYEFPNEYGIDA